MKNKALANSRVHNIKEIIFEGPTVIGVEPKSRYCFLILTVGYIDITIRMRALLLIMNHHYDIFTRNSCVTIIIIIIIIQ